MLSPLCYTLWSLCFSMLSIVSLSVVIDCVFDLLYIVFYIMSIVLLSKPITQC
ncbi:hypothetical protein HanRHA438_Chr17g0820831 [Helianthus annuus]|nr:hypothetical protein HanRHA438_Chr17g0820831 [Helianthus annuus]